MIPASLRRSSLARQVGSLALSHVTPPSQMGNSALMLRVAAWANTMGQLGVHLPLFVVHDLGLLLAAGRSVRIGPKEDILGRLQLGAETAALLKQYSATLSMLFGSELVEKSTNWRLRDDLIAVLLIRILGDLYHRWGNPSKKVDAAPLPLDPQIYADADLVEHFSDFDSAWLVGFLRFISREQLHVYTSLEQIDVDTVRLLGVGGGLGAPTSMLDLVDLAGVFRSSESNDVVSFSLELLPSVLETKRASGVQTFAVDGYASIERRGNLDALILSEFAVDDELFERKVFDNELYYYGHEKEREQKKRLHYLLVDSSPSMRGVRQVFARGLALTLAKKLSLEGDEVWMRFFDSRLYDIRKVNEGGLAVPYLLSFKSERGRNYGKVFRQLAAELEPLKQRDGRQIIVYILTHGQCHLPPEVVSEMRRWASLYGIFILPSSEIELDYLHLLDRHQIVDGRSLRNRTERRDRALEIVKDVGAAATKKPRGRA